MAFKYNPFQPNQMVAPGMFVGRLEEVDAIEQALFQAKNSNPQHFLIEGERGIGKSSLLFLTSGYAEGAIETRAGKFKFLVVAVDMGGCETQLDIVRSIARELKQKVAEREVLKERAAQAWEFLSKWEILGVRYHAGATPPDPDDARDALVNNIAKILEGAGDELDGVYIVIDEADAPPETADLGEFVKLLTERLTRRGCNNVLLGIAGLPSTIAKLRASHESSPRIFEVLHLAPLERDERKRVIERGLEVAKEKNGFETQITDDAMHLLCELSEGYPHFIQQFAYAAFTADTDNHIDVSDVIDGAYKENGAISQLGQKYFNEMYFGRINSGEYRKVLDAMAKYGDSWVWRQTLSEEAGVKATTLNNALNTLKTKKIILSDESRQGYYKLPTKSFAAWINAIRSVEAKAEDSQNLFE